MRAAEIEIPERLIPGIRASAWAPRLGTEPIGEQDDQAADHKRDGDQPDGSERALDDVAEQQADERRRDGRGDEQPGQPSILVVVERSIAHGGQPGRHEPQPVHSKIDEQRHQRSEMEHHAELERVEERVVPSEEERDDDEMP
jgi:hypothetical protein